MVEAATNGMKKSALVAVAVVATLVALVAVVAVAALPVVFWFSVGMSAATTALNVGVPAAPFGAAKNVLAVFEAKFDGVTDKVPPSVKLPELVTVPVSVMPLTVPVPLTLVTVPSGLFDH